MENEKIRQIIRKALANGFDKQKKEVKLKMDEDLMDLVVEALED